MHHLTGYQTTGWPSDTTLPRWPAPRSRRGRGGWASRLLGGGRPLDAEPSPGARS
jgi:hypothetical protein